jgi:hypothetical protein
VCDEDYIGIGEVLIIFTPKAGDKDGGVLDRARKTLVDL